MADGAGIVRMADPSLRFRQARSASRSRPWSAVLGSPRRIPLKIATRRLTDHSSRGLTEDSSRGSTHVSLASAFPRVHGLLLSPRPAPAPHRVVPPMPADAWREDTGLDGGEDLRRSAVEAHGAARWSSGVLLARQHVERTRWNPRFRSLTGRSASRRDTRVAGWAPRRGGATRSQGSRLASGGARLSLGRGRR